MAVAQAVNCTNQISGDFCGTCASCTRIPRRVHGDVKVVEPGENGSIGVDEVREALEHVSYRPFEGRRRVVIIDHADAATGAAQDALLKRLEEPTSGSMFILVTSQCDQLLPTVRSRCYQLRFAPLPDAEVVRVLVERHAMPEPAARAAAALSDGSIGNALARASGELADARDVAFQLLSAAASSDQPARRLAVAKTAAAAPSSRVKDRDALAARLEAAAAFLRDMQILTAGGEPSALTNADMAAELAALAKSFDRERGLKAFDAVEQALNALNRQANTKIVADWVALAL
jgi:DNA polymerase III subunit delta'